MLILRNLFLLYILIAVTFFVRSNSVYANDAVKEESVELKPEQQFLHTAPLKIENFTFGKKDLNECRKYLKQFNKKNRLPYLLILAEYYRRVEGRLDKSVYLIGDYVLNSDQIDKWTKANIEAEKEAEKEYKKKISEWKLDVLKAKRSKSSIPEEPDEPSGIYSALPPADQWNINENNVDAAIELVSCLVAGGRLQEALKVIDKIGNRFDNEGRVLAAECAADVFSSMQMYGKSVTFYDFALKYLSLLRTDDLDTYDEKFAGHRRYYTEEQKIIKNRIGIKLSKAKKLLDSNRYGSDWVLYRDAEKKRREAGSYIEAYLAYEDIIKNYPKNNIYGEASKCYIIRTLLALADESIAEESQFAIVNLQEKIKYEKKRLIAAKKALVKKIYRKKIENKIKEYEYHLKNLEAVPTGMKAIKLAKKRTDEFIKDNEWGLYRGEVLYELANYYLEYEYDEKNAEKYFQKALDWFTNVKNVDSDLDLFALPGKSASISAPPPTMRKHDAWGNLGWVTPKPGDLFNRRECTWYIDYFRLMSSTKCALSSFINGDKDKAQERIKVILEVDQEELALAQKGWPNSYCRLRDEFKNERLYATKDDLKHYDGKIRTQLMVADFYYEIEQWQEAYKRYRKLDAQHGDKLDTTARAYLDMMLGNAAWDEGKDQQALMYFGNFETIRKYKKTPSWTRAMKCLATFYQNNEETHEKTIQIRKCLIKHYGKTRDAWKEKLGLGTFYYSWQRNTEATVVFKDIVNSCKEDDIKMCASKWLDKINEQQK